ncbi:type II toxin-antitoxin system VapC family toxin (plasmid) [Deinococcus psychrotolerans]|uniref:Type II toxin-antitoxin system VapC family toxin n=1 Tax=Deinococcus psychrotolerans TaxID=2489213 RepID=A0A3G8YK69_9DEIO|nr:PIN domain-containing protein [Deinococcus psychrotolerans]AZI45100.1 type II toxin-antitoxin system VapC family toxin [Deinococcus psychrotolerans]
MHYLLDTNTVSDFFRQHPSVLTHFGQVAPSELTISSVTVMEIEYGFARQPAARQKFGEIWAAFQHDVTVLEYTAPDAVATGQLRAHLAGLGTPIGPFDLQLAGTALVRRLTLVSNNTAEFIRVPGLTLQDWRQA